MKRFILTMIICLMLSVTAPPVMGTEAEQQKDPLQAREAVHNTQGYLLFNPLVFKSLKNSRQLEADSLLLR